MAFTGTQRIQIGTGYVFIVPLGGNLAVPFNPAPAWLDPGLQL